MKNSSAQEMVSQLIASFKSKAKKEKDPALRKIAMSEVELTENAFLSIFMPFEEKQYKQSGEAAIEYADWLGALGLKNIILMFTEERMKPLASFRDYFLYAAGIALRSSGDMPSAFKHFVTARRLSLKHKNYSVAARASIDIGVAYYQKGDAKKAKSWYTRATREADIAKDMLTKAKALNNLGAMLMDEDVASAKKLLEQSIALKEKVNAPKEEIIPTLFNLGVLQAQAGERKKAYEIFKRSAQYTESDGDVYNLIRSLLNLGNEAAALGKRKEASGCFAKGIKLAKTIEDFEGQRMLHQGFAVAASKFEDYGLASREFKALFDVLTQLGHEGSATIALHDLALSLGRANKKTEARKYLRKALNNFKAMSNIDWQRRCLLLFAIEIEDWLSDSQLKFLKQAVDLKGGRDKQLRLNAIRQYWSTLLERGDSEEARHQLNREISWLKKDPKQISKRLHHAGMELLDKGYYSEALRRLKKALNMSLSDDQIVGAGIQQDLALAFAEIGDYAKASHLFKENIVLANDIKNRVLKATNLGNLGEVERRAGDLKESIAHLNEAVRLSRSFDDLKGTLLWLNNLALSLIEFGEFAKANEILKKGLKEAKEANALPEEARFLGTLGISKAECNQFEKAIKFYTNAIDVAKKGDQIIFALEMQQNRAAAFHFLNRRDEAFSDAYKIIKEAFNNRAFEMTSEMAHTAAIWSIEWKRPVRAGELSAFSLISGMMVGSYEITYFMALILLSLEGLSEKKYAQFYRALKNEIQQKEEGVFLWETVENIEREINKKFREGTLNHSLN